MQLQPMPGEKPWPEDVGEAEQDATKQNFRLGSHVMDLKMF